MSLLLLFNQSEASAGRNANINVTLANSIIAATSAVAITGAFAATLQNSTFSATATATQPGLTSSMAITLYNSILVANADVEIKATIASVLANSTFAAQAFVADFTGLMPSPNRTYLASATSTETENENFSVSSSGKIVYNKPKDPSETLDISLDWTSVLNDIGDTVSSSSVSVNYADKVVDATVGKVQTCFIANGILGETAEIEFIMSTNSTPPRTFVKKLHVKIKES